MLYIRMMVIMAVSLFTSRVVLHTLGVEDFGIYNVAGGIVAMFTCLNGSFSSATSRFITYELGKPNKGNVANVFSAAMTIHIVIAIVIFIIAETVGLWLLAEKLVIPEGRMTIAVFVYQISILTCMINITQVPYSASIIANERMSIYAYISIYEVVMKLIIVYLLVVSPLDKLMFYAVLLFVVQFTVAMIYRIYCIRRYDYTHFRICKDKTLLKPMLSFSGWDIYGTVSTIVSVQGINLVQNTFFGTAINAAAGIANQVRTQVVGFASNFLVATKPQIVKFYAAGEIDNMQNLAINAGKFSYLLLFLFACPLMIECEYVMGLWLVEVPDYAVVFCQLSLLYNLVSVMYQPCVHCIHAVGRMKLISFLSGTLFYLMIPVAYLFLRLGFGPESPYAVNVIFMIIINGTYISILHHYLKAFSISRYFYKVTVVCIFISMLSVVLPLGLHLLMRPSVVRLIMVIVTSVLSLVIFTWYIALNAEQRKQLVSKGLQRIRNKL